MSTAEKLKALVDEKQSLELKLIKNPTDQKLKDRLSELKMEIALLQV